MENQDQVVEAFLLKNEAFLRRHRDEMISSLEKAQPTSAFQSHTGAAISTKLNLDEDLLEAFNQAGGHPASQQVILQIQTNRKLDELIEALAVGAKIVPSIQGDGADEAS